MGRKQTEKQKLTIRYMAEGMDRYHAMLKAGYSESYARSTRIKEGEDWQTLIDKYIPEEKITEAVSSLINHEYIKEFVFDKKYSEKEVIEKMEKLGYPEDRFIIVEDKEYKNVSGDLVVVDYWKVMARVKDPTAVSNGTEKAIKIRGKYAPEQLEISRGKYEDLSDEELDELIAKKQEELNLKEK
jgi:hypothetical protein